MTTPETWLTVPGVIVRGHGVASGCGADSPYPRGSLEMQLPHFLARGLDLSPYFRGTLNVSIAPRTFAMTAPHYTFHNVNWTTLHPPEHFSFSRCRLIVRGQTHNGWVYYPHPETKIRHFQDPALIEIIAPFIPDLTYGDRLEIQVNPQEITVS